MFFPYPKKNAAGMEGEVKKKMGGTPWEEPIFFLTSPGMELQLFGIKGKNNSGNLNLKI